MDLVLQTILTESQVIIDCIMEHKEIVQIIQYMIPRIMLIIIN